MEVKVILSKVDLFRQEYFILKFSLILYIFFDK